MTKHTLKRTLSVIFTLFAVGCGDTGGRRSHRPSSVLPPYSDDRTETWDSPETGGRPWVSGRRVSPQIEAMPLSEVVGEYRLSAEKTLFTLTIDGQLRHHRADNAVKDFELVCVLDNGRELHILLNEVWHPVEKQIIRLKKLTGTRNGFSLLIGNRPPVTLFRVALPAT